MLLIELVEICWYVVKGYGDLTLRDFVNLRNVLEFELHYTRLTVSKYIDIFSADFVLMYY